jgi:8-oxo-dGTP pyrophosphatase MutT (NUDIX family)
VTDVVDIVWGGAVEVRVTAGSGLSIPPEIDAQIETIWREELLRRPNVTNGQILCASHVDRGVVTGRFVEYRVFVARERDSKLERFVPIEPVGVSGVVVLAGGRVVVGKRAMHMTQHPGAWELVPSGGIDGPLAPHGRIDPLAALLRELDEELGVSTDRVKEARPLGLLRDRRDRGYDICFELLIDADADDLEFALGEYAEFRVVEVAEAAALLTAEESSVPVSRVLIELLRFRP